jgi:hypothetical protein
VSSIVGINVIIVNRGVLGAIIIARGVGVAVAIKWIIVVRCAIAIAKNESQIGGPGKEMYMLFDFMWYREGRPAISV